MQRLYVSDPNYTPQNALEDAILTELKNHPKEHDPRTLIVALAGKAGISNPPTLDDWERMQETLRNLKGVGPAGTTRRVVRFKFIGRDDFIKHCKDPNTKPTVDDALQGSNLCYDSVRSRMRGKRMPEDMGRSIVKIKAELEKEASAS